MMLEDAFIKPALGWEGINMACHTLIDKGLSENQRDENGVQQASDTTPRIMEELAEEARKGPTKDENTVWIYWR